MPTEHAPAPAPRQWLTPVILLPFLMALPFFFGGLLLYRDALHFFGPQHAFSAKALFAGYLPQWNPFLHGGMPHLADPSNGVFYPPNLLAGLMSASVAETLLVLLHLPIAAAGCYWLARRLTLSREAASLAATGYVACGYLLSMHGGGLYFESAALLPAVLAALLLAADSDRLWALVPAALLVALLALTGDLQALHLVGLLSLALALAAGPKRARLRRSGRTLVSLGLGSLLAAPQLLPTLRFATSTARAHGLSLKEAGQWSLSPYRLLEWIVPNPLGLSYPDNSAWSSLTTVGPQHSPWAQSLFVGPLFVVGALLALAGARKLGPRARVLAGTLVASLLLALGPATPLFGWWFRWLPLANRFRYPEKFLLFTSLSLVLLGALYFDRWLAQGAPADGRTDADAATAAASRGPRLALGLLLFLATLLLVGALASPSLLGGSAAQIAQALHRSQSILSPAQAVIGLRNALLVASALCALFVGALFWGGRQPQRRLPLLLALCVMSGWWLSTQDLSFGNASFLEPEPPWISHLAETGLPREKLRILRDSGCRFHGASPGSGPEASLLEQVRSYEWLTGKPNFPMLAGVRNALGYIAADSSARAKIFRGLMPLGMKTLARSFGANLLLLCDHSGRLRLEAVPDPLPRASIVSGKLLDRPLIDALRDPAYSAQRIGLVETPAAVLPASGGAGVRILSSRPGRLTLETQGSGLLRLTESFDPGWQATLDGHPVQPVKVDKLWLGLPLPLPAAEHRLRLEYQTPGLSLGLWLGLLGLLACLGLSLAGPLARRYLVSQLAERVEEEQDAGQQPET